MFTALQVLPSWLRGCFSAHEMKRVRKLEKFYNSRGNYSPARLFQQDHKLEPKGGKVFYICVYIKRKKQVL